MGNIKQMLLTANRCYKQHKAFPGGKPKGIMVHSNGCQGVAAAAWVPRWNNVLCTKAAHANVDSKDIVQTLPYNIRGWHAGGDANADYLGIECTEPIIDTPADFNATIANLIDWIVARAKELGWTAANVTTATLLCHSEAHKLGIASNHGDVTSDPNYKRVAAKKGQGYFTRNGYSMDKLRAAVKARLAPPTSAPVPKPAPTPKPAQPATPSATDVIYAVKPGDTLIGIAIDHKTTAAALAAYNNIAKPNEISIGQKIRIPAKEALYLRYTYARDDYLSAIGNRFGINWRDIKREDGKPLDEHNMHVGDVLLIPQK